MGSFESVSAKRDVAGPIGFESPAVTQTSLAARDYIADDALSVSLFLASKLGRPLLLEGAPGVGKTELAKVVSQILGTELIRLQCYEGLELAQAAYEWNYPRQLLEIQARRPLESSERQGVDALFTEEYLLRRPLLAAIDPRRSQAPVLLIDELDRADEEFESFLLELLSDFQITIPELGTVRAAYRPLVLLTSNRTREVHDALKRRCLYHFIGYPTVEKEIEILARKVPGLSERLSRQVARFAERLRQVDLYKVPGVAESIDWARALQLLGVESLTSQDVSATVGCFLKHQDDVERLKGGLGEDLVAAATAGG
jgi:MoxR-like ATPase